MFFIENEGQAVAKDTDYSGSLYRRRLDMSTSTLECRRSQAACPGCGKTFTQGDAGG